MMAVRILIVDDERIARENLEHVLRKEGFETVCVDSGAKAIEELANREFDLVMTDLRMQGVDGMEVVEHTRSRYPNTEVIVITGFATVNTAVEAMQKGAFYYLPKPYQIGEVRILVHQAIEKRALRQEVAELKNQIRSHQTFPLIIGQNPKMEALKNTIEQVSPSDCTVMILGETGTGKELVAKTIHQLSQRAAKRFLAINCGAFNEDLLANELFGHEKEAFTGARGVRRGLLESVQGGTILLDEIGDMPLSMQVKLLRVLQERALIRVGGTEEVPIDIRILAATNKDLRAEVDAGRFRQDLYYRLNVITLHVPPLADRKDTLPLLCRHFMKRFSDSQAKTVTRLSDEAMDILMNYGFPGNVRELENIMERAVTLASGSVIETVHLPSDLQQLKFHMQCQRKSEFLTLEENEKSYIAWILDQTGNNKTRAAAILGIDRVSLWRKLRRYDLEE
jgi:DNA-binding NtrC family response regulator